MTVLDESNSLASSGRLTSLVALCSCRFHMASAADSALTSNFCSTEGVLDGATLLARRHSDDITEEKSVHIKS